LKFKLITYSKLPKTLIIGPIIAPYPVVDVYGKLVGNGINKHAYTQQNYQYESSRASFTKYTYICKKIKNSTANVIFIKL
jgi:hypothetical protein